jgi:hypothetical protein
MRSSDSICARLASACSPWASCWIIRSRTVAVTASDGRKRSARSCDLVGSLGLAFLLGRGVGVAS